MCRHSRSPRHLVQQGLSLLAGLAQAAGGHSWRWQCVSPDCGAERGAEHRVLWVPGVPPTHP